MNKEEFLKNFTFVSYIQTNPLENYDMKGAALVMNRDGLLVVFKHVKNKSGAYYWSPPGFSYKENGANNFKKLIDSTSQEMWLLDFVKENVDKLGSVSNSVQMSQSLTGGFDESQAPF